jgi:hypothetical protein
MSVRFFGRARAKKRGPVLTKPDTHTDRCRCLECFMAGQVARIKKRLGPTTRDAAREARRRAALADVRDEMVPFRVGVVLPDLDYYDGRQES